jgi:hypothetical protein
MAFWSRMSQLGSDKFQRFQLTVPVPIHRIAKLHKDKQQQKDYTTDSPYNAVHPVQLGTTNCNTTEKENINTEKEKLNYPIKSFFPFLQFRPFSLIPGPSNVKNIRILIPLKFVREVVCQKICESEQRILNIEDIILIV